MACLPWWHEKFRKWEGVRVSSGCSTSADGDVNCDPDKMRAAAEAKLRSMGVASSLSLEAYTLARYVASEVGSGSPEEKVAVIEAAINQAKRRGTSVNQLLLYQQASDKYGPIHAPEAWCLAHGQEKGCHPFSRWASTASDPTVEHLLITQFVVGGKSGKFNKGADDQNGPSAGRSLFGDDWPVTQVYSHAKQNDYWVGPLPGVDHWKTFLYQHRPDVSPQSTLGLQLTARAANALKDTRRPDWSGLGMCSRLGGGLSGVTMAGLGILGFGPLVYLAYKRRSSTY